MICPKCRSENVNMQVINEVHMEYKNKKKHSFLYWLVIGWWYEPLVWICKTVILFPFRIIGQLLPRKKYDVFSNKQKYICICQNCGYHWKSR